MTEPFDRYFGGRAGSAAKAREGIAEHYGAADGGRVFERLLTKRIALGLDDGTGGLRAQLRRKTRQSRG